MKLAVSDPIGARPVHRAVDGSAYVKQGRTEMKTLPERQTPTGASRPSVSLARPARSLGLGGGVLGSLGLVTALSAGCVIPLSAPSGAPPNNVTSNDGGTTEPSGDGASSGPVPPGAWSNATGNLANMASQCGNMSLVSAKPDEDLLIASVAGTGLWASRDGGTSWQSFGGGAGSATITNRGSAIVYDPQDTMRYWESGLYNAGGVYETTNDGVTFTQTGSVMDTDFVSIDFSDTNRKTLLAGGHEMSQTLNLSTNGGAMWSSIGAGLPAKTNCTNPLVIDSQTFLVGCGGYGGGPSGVYRSTNAGVAWTNVTTSGGAAAPLVASDHSIYWASPNLKGMARSTDQGQHWTDVVGANVVDPVHPIELPDGRLATLGTQYVLVSADNGKTWTPGSAALPYADAVDLTYSAQQKAFYIWHFTCGFSGSVPVPADGIMRFAFDATKP